MQDLNTEMVMETEVVVDEAEEEAPRSSTFEEVMEAGNVIEMQPVDMQHLQPSALLSPVTVTASSRKSRAKIAKATTPKANQKRSASSSSPVPIQKQLQKAPQHCSADEAAEHSL